MFNRLFYQQLLIFLLFWTASTYASPQDKIIFLHIPKSGGVTVSSLLMNAYDLNQIQNTNPKNIFLYSYGFHLSLFTIQSNLKTSRFKLVTFLRNPIDRILSEQRYCIIKHHANPEILIAHNLPSDGDPIETASNNMCKLLSGLDDKNPLIPIETHLKYAKKTLADRFFFFGITEKMEESIQLLYAKLKWEIPEEIPHFNQTDDIQFSTDIMQSLSERNWADIELYEYALALYEIRKIEILSSINLLSKKEVNFVESCYYTFDQKLNNGYGWGLREGLDDKNVYRWVTERNEAGLDFHLKSGNNYTVQYTALIQPLFHNQLCLFVNGSEIPVYPIDFVDNNGDEYRFLTYQAKIPADLIKKGEKTRLIFKMLDPIDPTLYEIFKQDNVHQSLNKNYLLGKFGLQEIRIFDECMLFE